MGIEMNMHTKMVTIDDLIVDLYRSATDEEWHTIRPRFLSRLARVLGLSGAAWWMHGRRGGEGELTQLPGTGVTVEELQACLPQMDAVSSLRKVSDQPLTLLFHYPHRNGVLASLLLLRFQRGVKTAELADLQRLFMHAIEAAETAMSFHIRRDDWLNSLGRPSRGSGALVDASGTVYVASDHFTKLLGRQGEALDALPFALPVDVLDGSASTFIQRDLHYRVSRVGELFLLYARRPLPLDQLSPREQEIARALGAGKTFKSVAREFGIAVSTVANHASRIYRKLAIYRREELIALLRTPPANARGVAGESRGPGPTASASDAHG